MDTNEHERIRAKVWAGWTVAFRRGLLSLLLGWGLGGGGGVRADTGHVPIVFEGKAGEYPARVVIRPPAVIPGLAQISVKVLEGDVSRVTVAPILWHLGKDGAPRPDVAKPVREEAGLYAADLWLMETGAHVVEVAFEGSRGAGKVLIPVPALATRVLGLPRHLGAVLGVLGVVLIGLSASIAGASVREAVLEPGSAPDRRRRRWAVGAMCGTTMAVLAAAVGGWRWWEFEAAVYRRHRLYRPLPIQVAVEEAAGARRLGVRLMENSARRLAPLVPDHGRLMHLFLVQEDGGRAFAHLHPERTERLSFRSDLPPLPAGRYAVYAQVTYETGFSETLTNTMVMPASGPAGGGVAGPDDAWTDAAAGAEGRHDLGDGYLMEWVGERTIRAGVPTRLRVRVKDRVSGQPAVLESYLGMTGHLVIRGRDADQFSHVHPGGTFSMASQQVFEAREGTEGPIRVNFGGQDPTCRLPTPEEAAARWAARTGDEGAGSLAFPFEFAESGSYRVWVQIRVGGRVRTGVFDLRVEAGKGS